MRVMRRLIVAVLLAGCVAGACYAAEPAPTYTGPKVVLKPRYAPGKYVLSATIDVKQENSSEGKAVKPSITKRLVVLGLDVGPANGQGQTDIQVTYRRLLHNITGGEPDRLYDSDGVPQEQDRRTYLILSGLLKTTTLVRVGADGGVMSIQGPTEYFRKLAQEKPPLAVDIPLFSMENGDPLLTILLGRATDFLPKEAVGPGDEWHPSGTIVLPIVGEMAAKRDCRLLGIDQTITGKIAVIEMQSVARVTQGGALPPHGGVGSAKVKSLEVHVAAKMRFNTDLGYNEVLETTQEGTGELGMTGADGQTRNLTLKGTSKMRVEISKDKEAPEKPVPAAKP